MLVVIGFFVLVIGLWLLLCLVLKADIDNNFLGFAIVTIMFIYMGIGIGVEVAQRIGDSLPVVVDPSLIPIQELSEKPGYWLKQIDTGSTTRYTFQVDGKELTYTSRDFDEIHKTCDGGNYLEIMRVNTGRKLVWLYAIAVNTSELTIHLDESCATTWYVN